MENFKYLISINQRAVVELGLCLDFVDMAIFDFIKSFTHSPACTKFTTEEGIYYWISHQKIIEQMPMLGVKTSQSVINRVNKLIEAGLLKKHPNCDQFGKTLYTFGDKYDAYEGFGTPKENFRDPLKNNLGTPQKKVEGINNIEDNIIEDNNDLFSSEINIPQNNKSPLPKKEKKGLDLSFVGIEFEDMFNEWLLFRRQINKMYKTQNGVQNAYNELMELSHRDPWLAQQIVQQAIDREWLKFYPLKTNNNGGSSINPQPSFLDQYTEQLKASGQF